jgi:hypothetical protein
MRRILFSSLVWATSSYFSHDFLDDTLTLDEAILEAMNGPDRPLDDMHHLSYFLLYLVRIQDDFRSTLSDMLGHIMVPLDTHGIYAERKHGEYFSYHHNRHLSHSW